MISKILKKESKKLFRAFAHPTFIYLTIIGNIVLLAATTAVYFLEKDINPEMTTFFDYLWWGVSTTTTIGYGDILPITLAGRVIAMMLMYTGAVLFVTFTGVILTVLMKDEVERELRPIEREMRHDNQQFSKIERQLRDILIRLDRIEGNEKKD